MARSEFPRASVLAMAAALLSSCGGSSPESLCEKMYKQRVEGPIKTFKELGPKNHDAYIKHCVTLPLDYLECDAMGMEALMSKGEEATKKCVALLKTHQEQLNRVLERGEAATATTSAPAAPPSAPAPAGAADEKFTKADCTAVCKQNLTCQAAGKEPSEGDVKACVPACQMSQQDFATGPKKSHVVVWRASAHCTDKTDCAAYKTCKSEKEAEFK